MNQIVYKLVMLKGPSIGEEFILDRPEILLGRDISNEISVNDVEVSRHHTKLIFQNEVFVVQDMGSTNGTFVNEQRVSGLMPLEDGAQIRIGDNVVFKYVIEVPDLNRTIPSQGKPASAPTQPEPRPQQPSAPPVQQQSPPPAQQPAPVAPPPQQAAVAQQPPKIAPAPQQAPANQAPASPAPDKPQGYTGRVPESPPSGQFETPFDMRLLGLGFGAILIVIAIILILVLMYVDRNMLWCDWLGWLIPNRCPIG